MEELNLEVIAQLARFIEKMDNGGKLWIMLDTLAKVLPEGTADTSTEYDIYVFSDCIQLIAKTMRAKELITVNMTEIANKVRTVQYVLEIADEEAHRMREEAHNVN